MQQRKLVIAAVVVAAMVALVAVFGSGQRAATRIGDAGGVWLEGLQPALGEVTRLRLQSGASVSTLVRNGTAWGVEERGGYPVDFARLGSLLRDLAEAKKLEQKTSKAEHFARLGLDGVEKPESKAVLVEIWNGGEQAKWRVLVGNAAEGRDGRYVRLADASETWLIDRSPQALAEPSDWLERKLIGVDFARVARLERTLAGAGGFAVSRKDKSQTSLVADAVPAGKKARYDTVFDGTARAVLGAELEDVRKAQEAGFEADGASIARNTIRTFDGLRLDIEALKAKDGNWIRVHAAAGEPLQSQGTTAVAEAAPTMPAADPATPPAEAGSTAAPANGADAAPARTLPEEVAELNGRLEGWAFKVSDYVYGELSKGIAEYIEDEKPAPEPAQPAKGDGPHDH